MSMQQTSFDVRVAQNGRVVLPKQVREALGITGEGKVTIALTDEGVQMHPMSVHVRRAQELYRRHAKNAGSVDDFLAQRRIDEQRRKAALSGKGPN